MNIVIDSNILFSAIIKDSKIRKIISEYKGKFLSPIFLLEEIEEHREELIKKANIDEIIFDLVLEILMDKIELIPWNIFLPKAAEALKIVEKLDLDDDVFIACALAHPGSILWSEDKKLKKQNSVNVLNTSEIALFLG